MIEFLRFLDLYYVLICLKFLSHGLALLEQDPFVCTTADVHPETTISIYLFSQEFFKEMGGPPPTNQKNC